MQDTDQLILKESSVTKHVDAALTEMHLRWGYNPWRKKP